MAALTHSLFDQKLMTIAARDAFRKLAPRHMVRNPVMFVVLVGSVLTTLSLIHTIATGGNRIGASESGVNVDDEVAQLTVLQNAYSANAHVLTVAKDMYATLFNAVAV